MSQAIALFTFTPQPGDKGQMSLTKGDIISNVEKITDSWWKGKRTDGSEGIFPAGFVHELVNEQRAVALYDWVGTKEAHLSLKKGLELNVLSTDSSWWQGYTDASEVGCFPGNYVKLIPNASKPAKPAPPSSAPPAKPSSAPPSKTSADKSDSTSVSDTSTRATADAAKADGDDAALAAVYEQLAAEARSSETDEERAAREEQEKKEAADAAAAARRVALTEKLRKMLTGDGEVTFEESDEARVQRVFDRMDVNSTGRVSRDELEKQFRRWERAGIEVKDIAQHFPGTKSLSFEEFREGVTALERAQPRRQVVVDRAGLRKLFDHYDKDNTGRVDRRRLKHLLKKLDFDALGTSRSKVLTYFSIEVAGSQPLEFEELYEGIEQMAFTDLEEETRANFFRVMHGKSAARRHKTAAAIARAGTLSTEDILELTSADKPEHRDETAASVRAAKLRAAFQAGLIRSNSMPRLPTTSKELAKEPSKQRRRKRALSSASKPRLLRRPIPEDKVIIIDNGSSFMKIGVSGEPMPRFVIPTLVGQSDDREIRGLPPLFGFDVLRYDGPDKLKIYRPLDPAKETDFDHMIELWDYIFDSLLHIFPEDHHVLMTELPDMSAQSTRRLYELMFEYFEVQSLYVGNPAEMALSGVGIETGIVVDCGNRMQIVPVVEGQRMENASLLYRVGAGNLNEFLARLITEHGNYFDPLVHIEPLNQIKAALCHVSLDPHSDERKSEMEQEKSMVLPSGKRVTVGSEAWRCPEGLFDPSLMGMDIAGVHGNVYQSIQKCPIDARNELFSHVVLAGGSTLFPQFPERLRAETRRLMNVASQRHLNIVATKNRKYLAWIGASICASMDTFPSMTMLNDDYFAGDFEEMLQKIHG